MIKVLFIIRDGFDANYLINHLSLDPNYYEVSFILENGKKARRKKLKRMIFRKRCIIYTICDLIALFLYDSIETLKMNKKLKVTSSKAELYKVSDVNDEECVDEVLKRNPDIIFIYGTGIVSNKTIKRINKNMYNIHSSILPYYRNVHSDFWAYMNNEFDKIGITILKLTSGIDSGDIALQKTSGIMGGYLFEHKIANLMHIPELVQEFMMKYKENDLHFIKQDETLSTKSNTPYFSEIITFFIKYKY